MKPRNLDLKLVSALVALFVLPIALIRLGPLAWFRRARESIREADAQESPAPSVYHIEAHDQATVDGDVRMELYGIEGRLGMLAVVWARWEGRPDKCNQLVFWVSEDQPVPPEACSSETMERLGLEHSPRPVAAAESYLRGLVISESMEARIRSLLDLACTYTDRPGVMKA